MFLYIIVVILIWTLIILGDWKTNSSKAKIVDKLKTIENYEVESEIKDENEKRYIYKGVRFLFELGSIILFSSKKDSDSKDTVFDDLYSKFASPKSENPKSTRVAKYFNTTLVYPTDYKTIKAFLCSDICSDRFPKNIVEHYCRGRAKGVLFNNGVEAKELRRYTMKTLGQLGFGKNHRMSEILKEQLTDLLENLENQIISTDNKIQVNNLFTNSAINVVWCIIGGQKFAHDDPNLLRLYENVEILTNLNVLVVAIMEYCSKRFITFFDIFGFGFGKIFEALESLDNYFNNFIEEKKLRLDESDPTDFVDHFLLEMEKHRSNDLYNKVYCIEQLVYVLIDLFAAGMDTTSKYMESAFMFMALNPDVQVKVQEEIDSIIGEGVPMHATHKKRMPFTEATLMEIHRMANIIPASVRMTNEHLDFDGQHFEKGTWIIPNLFCCRMDESYWGDPKVFRPSRFLDSENNLMFDKVKHVLPYGAGSRVCLGENVATSEIFVFFTGILQKYNVIQNDPNEFLGLSKGFAAVSHPEPFHVSLTYRNT